MDAFASIAAEWLAVANSHRARSAIMKWAQRRPSLGEYHSPADVVAAINQPGHADRSCALLSDVLLVAADDPLAQLAVMEALLPGLRATVRQRWKTARLNGPWQTQADLAAEAASAAWEAIRHHAGSDTPRPARLIIRRVERRLRTLHDAHRRDADHAVPHWDIDPAAALVQETSEDERHVAATLRQAVQSGELDARSARQAFQIGVLGEPPRTARHRAGLSTAQSQRSLHHALEVLAGETRATPASQPSRPPMHFPTQEDPVIHPTHPAQERSPILPLLLTVKQTAELLGIGRSTLYELLDAGELRSV